MSELNEPPQGLVASLQQSLAWLDMAMDGLADGLVIAHEDGRLRWANRSFSRTCGVESCVTLVDRSLEDLLGDWRPHEGGAGWSLLPLNPELAGKDGVITLQRGDDDDRRWMELHWRYLRFQGNGQLIVTLRDITLAVKADTARQQEEERLRLQLKQEQTFAQAMAHELRTPLAIANLELQCLGGDEQSPGSRIAAIRHELDRMARLLERVSWLNSLQLNPSSEEASTLEIIPFLDRWPGETEGPAEPLPAVQGDPEELAQLLQELHHNALRFGNGEPKLSMAREEPWLRLVVHTASTGLSEENLTRIFDRFVKLEHHRNDSRREGSGLGLPIARALARRMGGELTAENDASGQLCFVLTLRIAQLS